MQFIRHTQDYVCLSPIFTELEQLYAELSDPKKKRVGLFQPLYDNRFVPIVKLFTYMTDYDFSYIGFTDKHFDKVTLPSFNSKNIIVCYSGGKDSLAAIRHYQKCGYNVFAYHIKGLNKTYCDEWEVTEKVCDKLGVPLYIDSVSYSGNHVWVEHPMKNMLMALMALTWGVRNSISIKIAVGSFRTAFTTDNAFEVCGGDCMDMWKLFEDVVNAIIPSFQMYIPNRNFHTAYNLLLKEQELLPLTISCMTPNRFRGLFRKRTLQKYHVDLMPYRCGCCWKCATEYIWFCDHNVLDYDRDYYIHCLEILADTLKKETRVYIYRVEDVWSNYFFYSMRKSKAYKELKDAIIRSGKIKVAR